MTRPREATWGHASPRRRLCGTCVALKWREEVFGLARDGPTGIVGLG